MNSPVVEFHPEAVQEAVAAQQWYAERSPPAGQAFAIELEAATLSIVRSPDLYPNYIRGTKYCLLRRFPYMVVFRQIKERFQIIAVAHGRRRPGYWRKRTTN